MILLILFIASGASGATANFSTRLSPEDYLFGSRQNHSDSVFDKYKTVDLSARIGIGADCGQINFKSTLQAALRNVLDTKYLEDIGKNIIGASPMLLACYISPTWCSILKHSQIRADFLSRMRLNQCAIIDKYVDSRTQEYHEERQSCVRKAIERNGGDLEQAMESCTGSSIWQADIRNWAGTKGAEKVSTNKLIDSSARWAGFDNPEASPVVNLVKAFVGDTVISKGNVSVEYGDRDSSLSPRSYLQGIERQTYKKLCGNLVRRVLSRIGKEDVSTLVSEKEIKELAPHFDRELIDSQTLRSLALMSPRQRDHACRKLSDAIALSIFSRDANRSLDLLTVLSQNPNLPTQRKQEIEQKRKSLKDSVDMVINVHEKQNKPLNRVLSQINRIGQRQRLQLVVDNLRNDSTSQNNAQTRSQFSDCADGIMCRGGW